MLETHMMCVTELDCLVKILSQKLGKCAKIGLFEFIEKIMKIDIICCCVLAQILYFRKILLL